MKLLYVFLLFYALHLPLYAEAKPIVGEMINIIDDNGRHSGAKELPADGIIREVWVGTLYSSSFRIGICLKRDSKVSGVLYLKHSGEENDVYHMEGSWNSNELTATHHSGHSLQALMHNDGTVTGKISLKKGLRFSFEGKRIEKATLKEEDACF